MAGELSNTLRVITPVLIASVTFTVCLMNTGRFATDYTSGVMKRPSSQFLTWGGFTVLSKETVFNSMVVIANNFKVLNTVISLNPVFMVYMLIGRKFSTQVSFHNKAMFPKIFITDLDKNVALKPDGFTTAPIGMKFAALGFTPARARAVNNGRCNLSNVLGKFFTANRASKGSFTLAARSVFHDFTPLNLGCFPSQNNQSKKGLPLHYSLKVRF